MNPKKLTAFLWLAVGAVAVTACATKISNTPTPVLLTQESLPASVSPTARATARLLPTSTLHATASATPTRQPNDTFWSEVQNYGLTSASTVGPNDDIYSFYLVTDGQWFPGVCKLYVSRWDGRTQAVVWQNEGPGLCESINWEPLPLMTTERQALKLNGYWSDINQNGLPEFAVWHGSGCGFCDDRNNGYTALYEIQAGGQVKDITTGLSGAIVLVTPSGDRTIPFQILHGQDPTTIYVTGLFQYDVHAYVRIPQIHQWEGGRFINVSSQYTTEFQEWIEQTLQQIKSQYGQPLHYRDTEGFWRILGLYNESGLSPKEGLDNFLEISKPEHWPGTDSITLCWLQVMRAYTQMDYEQEKAFSMYLFDILVSERFSDPTLQSLGIDTARFDVSACKSPP